MMGALLLGVCGPARAEGRGTVAVLEFIGGQRAQVAVAAVLKKKGYTVIPLQRWSATARNLAATGRTADEIATVAGELGVDVVVTASVKRDKDTGRWVLAVSVRSGQTGKAVEKLRYPLKTQRIDNIALRQLLSEISNAVDKAKEAPREEAVAQAPQVEEKVEPPGKDDNPFEKMKQAEEAERRRRAKQRPEWYPFVDASVGLILGGRRFSFDEDAGQSPLKCYDFDRQVFDVNRTEFRYKALKKCPGFAPSLAGGIRLDVTGYPLAFLPYDLLRGLGVGGTFDIMFWPSSRVCNMKNADGSCASPGVDLATSEFRAEVGLRWQWNFLGRDSPLGKVLRPSLLVMAQYGIHQFAIQKEMKKYKIVNPMTMLEEEIVGIDDHGLPDIRYQYIDLGLGGRVLLCSSKRFCGGTVLEFHYHAMLDYGDIQTRFIDFKQLYGGYGPVGGGYGLRVSWTLLEFLWRGFSARLNGYYEVFAMSFDFANPDKGNPLPPEDRTEDTSARHIAQGASDHYFGGIISLGYQY